MIRFTERDMADSIAGNANIARLWGTSDHTVMLRRMHDYRCVGVSAASLAENVASSGHSDPTVDEALSGHDNVDLVQVAILHRWATGVLERAMAYELTRPTTPTPEQAKAADQAPGAPPSEFRPGAGECDACGRPYPGGKKRNERVHPVDGKLLCYSHLTGRISPEHKGRSIDDYIASVQYWMSTRGIPRGGNLDDVAS